MSASVVALGPVRGQKVATFATRNAARATMWVLKVTSEAEGKVMRTFLLFGRIERRSWEGVTLGCRP